MQRAILVGVSVVIGAASCGPIADALAPKLVGVGIPTRLQDLVSYVAHGDPRDTSQGTIGPATDPDLALKFRELGALSIGAGVAVAALSCVLLTRILK